MIQERLEWLSYRIEVILKALQDIENGITTKETVKGSAHLSMELSYLEAEWDEIYDNT